MSLYVPSWMLREKRREMSRAVVCGLLVAAALTWGIYGR